MMIAVCLATDDPETTLRGEGCSDEHTYTYVNSTAFHENLNAVFASLNSNLSSDGFATSIQNKSSKTDTVYGLAVCRQYLSARECLECVKVAETEVKKFCPRSNGGRVHLDGCSVRYENSSFYDEPVDGGMSSNCSSTNDGDPQTPFEKVEDLSKQLIANASASKGYAVGSVNGSLYGLAQCWPSLSNLSCQACLMQAQTQLLKCPPMVEGRGLEAGCFMRYSTYSFFSDNHTSSSSTNLAPSSSPKISMNIGSVGATALISVVCFAFCRRI